MPMMALSGVRSSWLMLARKSDLARLAISACSLAARSSAFDLLEFGQVEIGEHAPAVRQGHDLVLQHAPVGSVPFPRRQIGGPDLGEPSLDVGLPLVRPARRAGRWCRKASSSDAIRRRGRTTSRGTLQRSRKARLYIRTRSSGSRIRTPYSMVSSTTWRSRRFCSSTSTAVSRKTDSALVIAAISSLAVAVRQRGARDRPRRSPACCGSARPAVPRDAGRRRATRRPAGTRRPSRRWRCRRSPAGRGSSAHDRPPPGVRGAARRPMALSASSRSTSARSAKIGALE